MEAMSTVGSERLAEVVPDVLSALHEVLERHRVTEQEWMAALAFLTEVGRADEFVLLSDVTRTSVLIDALSQGDEDGATAKGRCTSTTRRCARVTRRRSTTSTRGWAMPMC